MEKLPYPSLLSESLMPTRECNGPSDESLGSICFQCLEHLAVAVVPTYGPALQEAVAAAVAHDICGSLLVVDETLLDGIAKAALGSPLDPPDSPGNLFLGYWRGKVSCSLPCATWLL